jgi:ubiquinol-cytochrome c reductase cytochrome b subunit
MFQNQFGGTYSKQVPPSACISLRHFYCNSLQATQRIGPHNEEVISTLVGSLLGDGWGEKRSGSSRFHVHLSSRNVEYLAWLQKFFYERGYCADTKPKMNIQVGPAGKIYRSCKFRTWSFRSLNWLYDSFYNQAGKKQISPEIGDLLTPRALAIWLMDDGSVSGSGIRISTDSFAFEEVISLQKAIRLKFDLETTVQRHKDKWILYFPKKELPTLVKIVKPNMIPSMHYKLNGFC